MRFKGIEENSGSGRLAAKTGALELRGMFLDTISPSSNSK
jgi:hypothetical protein